MAERKKTPPSTQAQQPQFIWPSRAFPALDGARRAHLRTFEACLTPRDEAELSWRLAATLPQLRYAKIDDVWHSWRPGAPYPPFPIYRSLEQIPGADAGVAMLIIPEDWRPKWTRDLHLDKTRKPWKIGNLPFPRAEYTRPRLYRISLAEHISRLDQPEIVANHFMGMTFRVHWDPTDPESKRMANAIVAAVHAVSENVIQIARWRRPLVWSVARDRARYGKHALAWATAAPLRCLGFNSGSAVLPFNVDPLELGFVAYIPSPDDVR